MEMVASFDTFKDRLGAILDNFVLQGDLDSKLAELKRSMVDSIKMHLHQPLKGKELDLTVSYFESVMQSLDDP
eukprot:22053-Lingulodinium_polyedra.AAC.1